MLVRIALIGCVFATSCVHRPIDQLVLADAALKAAQKAKADAMAPDAFRKAENYFLRAKKDYSEGYFDSSLKFADEARRTAEQAEFQALLKQTQVKGRPLYDTFEPPSSSPPPPPKEETAPSMPANELPPSQEPMP